MKKIRNYQIVLSALLLIFISACKDPEGTTFYDEDDVSITNYFKQDTAKFSMWLRILSESGVDNSLAAYNPYGNKFTVFAPTNDAVNKFIEGNRNFTSLGDILDSVQGDGTPFVVALAKYHVVNRQIETIDFSYGALQDTTATGDYINITFRNDNGADSAALLVNNESVILEPDIEQINGVIHVIDKMLEPSTNSALKWILDRRDKNLSIFAQALVETKVSEMMTLTVDGTENGARNRFTVWAVPDETFEKYGISDFDDLVERFDNTGNLSDVNNNLRIFMAYHISNTDLYLNDFTDRKDAGTDNSGNKIDPTLTLETFANLPLKVVSDNVIRMNEGGPDLDTMFVDGDTITVNYTSVLYGSSNVTTRNGPVHMLDNLLEVENVGASGKWLVFHNSEPELQAEWSTNRGNTSYLRKFDELDIFNNLKFRGLSYFYFGIGKYWSGDGGSSYISMFGDFFLDYTTPNKISPGRYMVKVRVDKNGGNNASVQFYWDGQPLGTFWPLVKSSSGENKEIELGVVDVTEFKKYTLGMETIKPGYFKIWTVILTPVN